MLCVIAPAGCARHLPQLRKSPNVLPQDPRLSSLDRAIVLQDQGDHVKAVMEFRNVIDCAESHGEREEARIGAAKSLIRLHRYAAASAVLGTLPAVAESESDCRKMAIAGEILLRQRRTEEAETCLELALDACDLAAFGPPMRPHAIVSGGQCGATNQCEATGRSFPVTGASLQSPVDSGDEDGPPELVPPGVRVLEPVPGPLGPELPGSHHRGASPLHGGTPPPPAWLAGCCANLGCAYLKNDKPEKALVMYQFAAHLSRQRGKHIAAERAQRVCDELNAVLRQYAPNKPHPVTQRFRPGMY
jgi:hypothetical protein